MTYVTAAEAIPVAPATAITRFDILYLEELQTWRRKFR